MSSLVITNSVLTYWSGYCQIHHPYLHTSVRSGCTLVLLSGGYDGAKHGA